MREDFSRTLSLLRQERGISQRKAAAELGVSQALLSHYENGIREPGLNFVTRACDYYNVSADFMLGRTLSRDGAIIVSEELYDASQEKGSLKGSIMATLQKKLVVNTACLLFDVLGAMGDRAAITAAGSYLSDALYQLLRLYTGRPAAMRATFPPRQHHRQGQRGGGYVPEPGKIYRCPGGLRGRIPQHVRPGAGGEVPGPGPEHGPGTPRHRRAGVGPDKITDRHQSVSEPMANQRRFPIFMIKQQNIRNFSIIARVGAKSA